jgi:hypothetical protein
MKPTDVRVEEISGKKRTLRRGSCAVCKQCWIYDDNLRCLYGGPFTGYQEIVNSQESLEDVTTR